jgi:hypothetical protein
MKRRSFLALSAAGVAVPIYGSFANMLLGRVGVLPDERTPLDQYPLVDALLKSRARRFFKGARMPGGPLKYQSTRLPQRLSLEQEALMAFAAAGITGYALAELPYHNGPDGQGNTMVQFVGRTVSSADALHAVILFITNDDGTWMLRRPQDLSAAEAELIITLLQQKQWVAAYEKLRVQISKKRTAIPRNASSQATFNFWAANRPGTTYFIPVIDHSAMYLAASFQILNPHQRFMIADDRRGWKPAGLEGFTTESGGYLPSHPSKGVWIPMSALETSVSQLATIEIGGMVQNLRLMAQALGLGGFPHSAGVPGAWQFALGFAHSPVPSSKLLGEDFVKLVGADIPIPTAVGLDQFDKSLIRCFCPPHYKTMPEAVKAYVDFKFGPHGTYRDDGTPTAWKNPLELKSKIPKPPDWNIAAVTAHAQYVFEQYGRFPGFIGPTTTVICYQAHVLDPAFYEKFYRPGVLPTHPVDDLEESES